MHTIGLSQIVIGLTHAAGHTLDLIFCFCHETRTPITKDVVKKSLSWSEDYLLGVKISVLHHLSWGDGLASLMKPVGIQNSLGDIPTNLDNYCVDGLVGL